MNDNIIQEIQERILSLLPDKHRHKPDLLLIDSCSELSRLVADWIIDLNISKRILILKGVNVCKTKKAHDILIVLTDTDGVYVIDPTIWQFFPRATSILVTIKDNTDLAFEEIKKIYGGEWSVSEEFVPLDKDLKNKYLDIISQNVIENLK